MKKSHLTAAIVASLAVASTIVRDKDGNYLSSTPCSQPHPLGPLPRDPLGRPYIGEHAGKWEPNSPDDPSNPESRTAKIIAAINGVDRTNPNNVTASGKPMVEAIERVLGEQISWQVRDLVWRHVIAEVIALQADNLDATSDAVRQSAARIDSRQSLIEGAIRRLDRDNKDLWVPKGGKPKVEAIEALIGGDVTSAERDAAWHILSQE